MPHKLTTIFSAVAITFFLGAPVVFAGGFGVSPSSVINSSLVPGSFYEETIYLVQSDPSQDLNAIVSVDAGQESPWISIENGTHFVIPKGTHQFPMKVDVAIPANAPLGEYKGSITVNTSPTGSQAAGVSVVLGADVGIDLTVSNITVSNFAIQNFLIPDVIKGSPISFVMKVKNLGNVENGPDKVVMTLFDQYHAQQIGDPQTQTVTQKVPSFQTASVSVPFPETLDVGQYWGDVQIYSDDKVVATSRVVFYVKNPEVIAKNTTSKGFTLPSVNFSAVPLWVYAVVLAVIIIIALVVLVIVLLVKMNKQTRRRGKK
jgi:hypothetical protein